jgi:hypothetical protein
MRLSPVTILICLAGLMATGAGDLAALADDGRPAADEPRRTQIEAARADALAALRQDVLEARLNRDLTVGQFADRAAGGRDRVLAVVRDAEQIGGTRWLDEHTCEVRLDLAGGKVSRTLAQIATDNPGAVNSVARPDLDRSLKRLDAQQFSASGVSTTSLESIRPPAGQPAWSGLSEQQVRKAVEAAHQDAADRLLESVRAVALSGSATVGDALANPSVHKELRDWLLARPITSAEFREDREVRLAVYAPSDDFFDVLKSALDRQGDARLRLPGDPAAQQQVRTQISRRMEPAIGRAVAAGGMDGAAAAPPQARQMVPEPAPSVSLLPRNVPNWIGDQLDAKGTAQGRWPDRLRTAHQAETDALKRLRDRVGELPLTGQLKLGEAARRDPRIDRALDRALRHARAFKVDYGSDGTVYVLMSLDLQDLWAELEASQYAAR